MDFGAACSENKHVVVSMWHCCTDERKIAIFRESFQKQKYSALQNATRGILLLQRGGRDLGWCQSLATHIFRGWRTWGRWSSGKAAGCPSCSQVLWVERPQGREGNSVTLKAYIMSWVSPHGAPLFCPLSSITIEVPRKNSIIEQQCDFQPGSGTLY